VNDEVSAESPKRQVDTSRLQENLFKTWIQKTFRFQSTEATLLLGDDTGFIFVVIEQDQKGVQST
jgi:hypothetical protein